MSGYRTAGRTVWWHARHLTPHGFDGRLAKARGGLGKPAVTFDCAKSGLLTAPAGIVEPHSSSKDAARFHAMGIDLADHLGQDKANTRGLVKRATATTRGDHVLVGR